MDMAYDFDDFKLEKRYCSETGCNVAFKCFRDGTEMCLESGRCRKKNSPAPTAQESRVFFQNDFPDGDASRRM